MFFTYRARAASRSVRSWASSPGRGLVVDIRRRRRRMRGGLFYWLYRKFYWLFRKCYWLFRNFYWLFRNFYWLFRNFYWLFRKSRPVRAASKQPRATPWGSGTHKTRPVRAKAFKYKCFCPYRADYVCAAFPGRCPGLIACWPFRPFSARLQTYNFAAVGSNVRFG